MVFINLRNRFQALIGNGSKTVNLLDELQTRRDRLRPGQDETLDGQDDGMLSSRHMFSRQLALRVDAAVAAEITRMVARGTTSLRLAEDQSIESAVLGRQATQFRVYDRDLNRDLTIALSLN